MQKRRASRRNSDRGAVMPWTKLPFSVCVLALSLPCSPQSLPEGIFSVGQFKIGQATFDDVLSHFGPNKPYPLQPGDGADLAMCYSNGTGSTAPAIVFETGALGGWQEITAYRLTHRSKRQCRLTSVPVLKMATRNGFLLSTSRQVVINALGRSNATKSVARLRAEDVYQRAPTDEEAARMRGSNADPTGFKFDVVDMVDVRFKGGVVDELYVRRLVSY
jgi:hypothetical protein